MNNNNESNFTILAYADNNFDLQIKEGLYIQWLRPVLNKQINSYTVTLAV